MYHLIRIGCSSQNLTQLKNRSGKNRTLTTIFLSRSAYLFHKPQKRFCASWFWKTSHHLKSTGCAWHIHPDKHFLGVLSGGGETTTNKGRLVVAWKGCSVVCKANSDAEFSFIIFQHSSLENTDAATKESASDLRSTWKPKSLSANSTLELVIRIGTHYSDLFALQISNAGLGNKIIVIFDAPFENTTANWKSIWELDHQQKKQSTN